MSDFRKDLTQASLNLASSKFVVIEMLVLSVALASYFSDIYIFAASLLILLLLFYIKITSLLVSVCFALIWALMPSMIISIFTNVDLITSLPNLLSSASSQVFAFILFWVAFYFHITCADFLRDALDPIFKIFKKSSKKSIEKSEKIKKKTSNSALPKTNSNIVFISEDKVDPHLLRLFLEEKGFGLYQTSEDRNIEKKIILNENGIIKFFSIVETKRWIRKYIDNASSGSSELLGVWVKFSDIALKKSVIDHLMVYSSAGYENTIELNELKDTKNVAYKAFKNCIVKITKNNYKIISYEDLAESVWESSIIKREFQGSLNLFDASSNKRKNLFKTFIEMAVLYKNTDSNSEDWRDEYMSDKSTEKTLLSLRTALGYLIHSYNDPSCAKAVFFVDKLSTEEKPEGGTGKSLIAGSINHLISQSTQDGKKYKDNPNLGGRFQFSNVDEDTKNIFIDDLRKDFSIESIFTMVTGDIEVERKGKDKIVIPKEKRPKIVLTTNYQISNQSTSYKRRIHQVALGDYWNRCINEGINPKDEIGKELFGYEFSQEDWDDFYVCIIECISDYLRLGLK